MVEVSFENGTKEIMPKKRLETVGKSSEEKGKPLEDRQILQDTLANILLGVFMEYGVKVGEVDGILNSTVIRINKLFDSTYEMQFGFEKPNTPISVLNKIEVENFKKQNGDQTS